MLGGSENWDTLSRIAGRLSDNYWEAAEYLGARRIPGNSVTNFLPVWRMETTATPAKSSLAASCTASSTS